MEKGARMKIHLVWVIALGATACLAQNSADREKLLGSWETGQSETHSVWTLEAQGSSLHITNSLADKKLAEFACDLGKECEVKDAGRKVKVLMYFNGPKIVVMETRGEEVFKRRFGVADPGNVLEVEMIPVVPDGKPETVRFTRVQTVAAKP